MTMLLTPEAVAALLTNLFGKRVAARKTGPLPPDAVKQSVVAIYAKDDGATGAIAIADLKLAAFAGAALAMIPPGYAAEVAETGKFPENILENFSEILNIGSRWFNSPRTPHVVLRDVLFRPQAFAPDVGALLRAPGYRVDLVLTIPGYGEGNLTLLAAGLSPPGGTPKPG